MSSQRYRLLFLRIQMWEEHYVLIQVRIGFILGITSSFVGNLTDPGHEIRITSHAIKFYTVVLLVSKVQHRILCLSIHTNLLSYNCFERNSNVLIITWSTGINVAFNKADLFLANTIYQSVISVCCVLI